VLGLESILGDLGALSLGGRRFSLTAPRANGAG
jgi:hypothetical protein